MFVFLSEGPGLSLLMTVLFLSLVGIGVAVHYSRKKDYFGNILLPCVLIAVSIIFFAITFSFPKEDVGPAVIPHLWIFWTVILCSLILFQVMRGSGDPDPEPGRIGFLLLIIALFVVYYIAMQTMGYFLSSFLFLVVVMHILSYRKKLVIFLVAGSWVLFSYVVFYKMLFIQLPLGYFEYFF